MDSELLSQVLLLLTSAMTVWQEWRHRKNNGTSRPSPTLEQAAQSGPFKTRPKGKK